MGSFSGKCRLRMATFSSGAYCFRCFFMRSLLYLTGRTPSPFPTEPEQMFVGEQPGDQEDRKGRPFVGAAGRILDQALEQAGIDRKRVYVTNAVKHFKFEE